MTTVLDASALIATLRDEPGAERVDAVLHMAVMTTVNLAEVVSHFAKLGATDSDIDALLADLPITYVAPDKALAIDAGLMLAITLKAGLSLGDRMCLALARSTKATALTADRAWQGVAEDLGVDVELIR